MKEPKFKLGQKVWRMQWNSRNTKYVVTEGPILKMEVSSSGVFYYGFHHAYSCNWEENEIFDNKEAAASFVEKKNLETALESTQRNLKYSKDSLANWQRNLIEAPKEIEKYKKEIARTEKKLAKLKKKLEEVS